VSTITRGIAQLLLQLQNGHLHWAYIFLNYYLRSATDWLEVAQIGFPSWQEHWQSYLYRPSISAQL
jgi:hypothetical protein